MKTALITGITGQDGSYLTELLLDKGYSVHGIRRRSSAFNTSRIDHLIHVSNDDDPRLKLHYGDLTDSASILRIVQEVQPDEIYNLAAQSHVGVSFQIPEYTSDVVALGTLRLLEAVRSLDLEKKIRFYQASSSELFGLTEAARQMETTPFYPRSPYAAAKLYAYWICKNYREAYGLYACNGILFNHESPRRGETFVTRKITRGFARLVYGLTDCLHLGNLDAKRDWGHARDFVKMQWLMLQQDVAEDYVIATGIQYSVREFLEWTANEVGIKLIWKGKGIEETAYIHPSSPARTVYPKLCIDKPIVKIDPRYFRPAEVNSLLGDSARAREKLGWHPTITARELCKEMIENDLRLADAEAYGRSLG